MKTSNRFMLPETPNQSSEGSSEIVASGYIVSLSVRTAHSLRRSVVYNYLSFFVGDSKWKDTAAANDYRRTTKLWRRRRWRSDQRYLRGARRGRELDTRP